jgi:hypothetical protein
MNKFNSLVVVAALVALSSTVNAQVLLSDSFNSENGGVGQLNYNSFANWNVANSSSTGGTVDLIGNGFFDFYPGNGLYIDLDGSGNGVPGLLQSKTTFTFDTGVNYTLSFDLAGSARGVDDHVDVTLGSILNQVLFLPSSQGYTLFTYNFTVSSDTSAALSFQNVELGDVGAILDNVDLSGSPAQTGGPVPDGGNTLLLAAGALLALGAGVPRYRKCVLADGIPMMK